MDADYNVLKMEDNGCSDTLDMPGKNKVILKLFMIILFFKIAVKDSLSDDFGRFVHGKIPNRLNHLHTTSKSTFHDHATYN